MVQGRVRLGLAVAALVALWVAVYWWTPGSSDDAVVSFEQPAADVIDPAPIVASSDPAPQADHTPPASATTPAETRAAAKPPAPVIPPSFHLHTVEANESAESISRRYFGTTAHWSAIMRANPKTDFQHLRKGMTIRVPKDPSNTQGVPNPAAGKSSKSATAPTSPVTSLGVVDYLVEPGDTLTGLAVRFYGRSSAWTLIRDANLEKLGADGSKLRSGMKIIIPPARAEGAAR